MFPLCYVVKWCLNDFLFLGGTTLSGTPDRWANRLLGDPNLPHSNPGEAVYLTTNCNLLNFQPPACRRGSSGAESLRSGILSEMRGETFSLLRGRRTEISTPTEEEAKEDIEEEEMEDIEEEEGRREVSTGEERGSSRGTGEKGNFKPAGLLAGRRETGGFYTPSAVLTLNIDYRTYIYTSNVEWECTLT